MLISTRALSRSALKDPCAPGEELMRWEPSQKSECVTFGGRCLHPGHSHCGPAVHLLLRINLIDNVDTSNELCIDSHLIMHPLMVICFFFCSAFLLASKM